MYKAGLIVSWGNESLVYGRYWDCCFSVFSLSLTLFMMGLARQNFGRNSLVVESVRLMPSMGLVDTGMLLCFEVIK